MHTSGQIQRSVRRFRDYANDLLRSDYNTFDEALRVFVHFCESDPVFSDIHAQLSSVPKVDFDRWYAERTGTVRSMVGSGSLSFPTDTEQKMALMYELLRRINDERVSFNGFIHNFFALSSSSITDYIHAFNDAITEKLVRELEYRLDDVLERLPDDQKAPVPAASIQIIHHATNVIQQNAVGSRISQVATQDLQPELQSLFAALREAAVSNAASEKKGEVEEIVTTSENLAAEKPPKKGAIRALFSGLPPVASVLSIVASIMKILG